MTSCGSCSCSCSYSAVIQEACCEGIWLCAARHLLTLASLKMNAEKQRDSTPQVPVIEQLKHLKVKKNNGKKIYKQGSNQSGYSVHLLVIRMDLETHVFHR